jgi:hypothetical protein
MWPARVFSIFGLMLAPLALIHCDSEETPPGSGIPVLTTLDPASAIAGLPALTLRLAGQEFSGASVVRWAGDSLKTTFLSGSELRAEVPADLLASPGSFDISVDNVAPGGGSSAAKTFVVHASVATGTGQ